jgi:hypothetical protein
MLGITYLAEMVGQLTLVAGMAQLWPLPFLIYLNAVDTSKVNRWVIYAVTTLLLSYPNGESPMPCRSRIHPWRELTGTTAHPIQVGWNSRNSNTVRSRTVSAACYNMFVQTSATIASNIYRAGKS